MGGFGVVFGFGGGGIESSAAVGFGFEGVEGSENEVMGICVEFSGFGDGEKEVGGADPFVSCGDEGGAGGGFGGGGLEASFFVVEGAELLADMDPFVDEGAEAVGGRFFADEDFVELGADFGGKSGGECCGLSGFVAVGFLDAGESVWDEEIAQFEEGGAIGGAEEFDGGAEESEDTANDVVVSVVEVGLFFDDFKEAWVEGCGLRGVAEFVVCRLDAG